MENIILFGASEQAKVVLDIIEKQGRYNVLGLIDDNKEKGGEIWHQYKIIGKMEDIGSIPELYGGIISIGDNWTRAKVVDRLTQMYPTFKFINAIHPSAQIARGVEMGIGNVVMANTSINSSSIIGNHCIVNTRASLDHDNILEDFVSIAPGATTGGVVKIGKYTSISLGVSIIHGIEIGKHTVVGAGAAVIRNIPDYSIAFGVPAKVKRSRKEGERYL